MAVTPLSFETLGGGSNHLYSTKNFGHLTTFTTVKENLHLVCGWATQLQVCPRPEAWSYWGVLLLLSGCQATIVDKGLWGTCLFCINSIFWKSIHPQRLLKWPPPPSPRKPGEAGAGAEILSRQLRKHEGVPKVLARIVVYHKVTPSRVEINGVHCPGEQQVRKRQCYQTFPAND